MNYTSFAYFLLIIPAAILYHIFPQKSRWLVLLTCNAIFYMSIVQSRRLLALCVATGFFAWIFGLFIIFFRERHSTKDYILKVVFIAGIILTAAPLLASRAGGFLFHCVIHNHTAAILLPVGASFYTLQAVGYLADIWYGKIQPEKNILKFALFLSFFPNIIQGPIERFDKLQTQLLEGKGTDTDKLTRGFGFILWGYFLKFLIADKAAVIVNEIFDYYSEYPGMYVFVGGILYSIQLYADFSACVIMSKGAALLFGISISENFQQPYISSSVKDFWRRWHMSFSFWLRDYVYIPLGGNRHGKSRRYVNLIATFAVSGLWHGGQWKYLFWGLLHAVFQIGEELLARPATILSRFFKLTNHPFLRKTFRILITDFLVMLAWIIFRAESLRIALKMIWSSVSVWNPWIFFDDSLYCLGLSQKEVEVLIVAILFLFATDILSEKKKNPQSILRKQPAWIRYTVYIFGILTIWIYGTYGFGFNAQDFIYGGF